MADSPSTAIPEAAKATSTAQPPVQDINVVAEMEGDRASAALAGRNGMMDRMVRAIGGGSPQASPSQFAGALGGSSQVGMLRQLQRSYGNSYVGRVIQAKLAVGQPGDRYEEEADRIADEVMRMPELTIQRQTEPEAAEKQTVPTRCVVNPGGSHLPPMGTVHPLPPGTPLRPCHLTEAQVRSIGNWCSDNHPHSGERCYRRIPTRSGLTDCPPGDQYCFTPDGCCHSSPDIHSPVNESSPPVPGLCNDHPFCATQHFIVDYLPSKIRRLRQQAEEEMRRRRE
jgi:hypothetical protein